MPDFLSLITTLHPGISQSDAEFILWNYTCYPFDDAETERQLKIYFAGVEIDRLFKFYTVNNGKN